ncbi:hypothetical protein CG709_19465 [Lachnotalea glycerini]|nr:hypothetical protein CG709_19465 [Lachnotalea glycerini]
MITTKRVGKAKIGVTTENGKRSECIVIIKPNKMPKVKAVNQGDKSVKLTWSKVSYVSGYEIYCKKPGNKEYKLVKNIKKNSKTSVTLKNLKVGKKYYYKIRAYVKIDGKKYYGDFSNVRKISISKT